MKEELLQAKSAYIKEQADLIEARLNKDTLTTKVSTCDAGGFGWDVKLHAYFPDIAKELRARGFTVAQKFSWGVTDWTITV